jgi:hypothetical protein
MASRDFWRQIVTIYLYHFNEPFKHSQHYLGSAEDYEIRAAEHASGQGAALMAAVVQAGIPYQLARLWKEVPRFHEVILHRRKRDSVFCPICSGEVALSRGLYDPSTKRGSKDGKRNRKAAGQKRAAVN